MIAGLPTTNMAGPGSSERQAVREKISSVFRVGRRGQDRRSVRDRMHQVEEYVAWVNSHLKKRTGSPLIYDLRSLQDGVTLVSLAEVLSQREVPGVDPSPSTPQARAANLEAVVSFLCETGVRLPETALTDLREGSLKGTLKVILALAQHYHPMSIRHSVKGGRNLVSRPSGRDSVASTPHRPTYSPMSQGISADESLSQGVNSCETGLPLPYAPQMLGGGAKRPPATFTPQYVPIKGYEGEEQCSVYIGHSSDTPSPDLAGVSPIPSTSSFAPAHRSNVMSRDTPISGFTGVSGVMPYTDSMISPPATVSSGAQSPALPPAPAVDAALPSLDSAMADITGLKGHLLQLYALLRDNPDGQETDLADHSWSNSELQLLEQNGSFMAPLVEEGPEVQQLREDFADLQSECAMLRAAVDEKEEIVRQLKADILRLDYKTETEREELRNMVSEKQLVIDELDLRLEEKSAVSSEQEQELERLREQLRQQQRLHFESVKMAEKESEMADMKGGASFARGVTKSTHGDSVAAEVDVIRQCMSVLRKEAQLAQHKPLDRLEEAVSRLMDYINTMATKRARHERHKERERRPAKRLVSGETTPTKTVETVKVMYTLDRDDTPYRITVPHCGPYGPTLAEFKAALGRKGHFKYFFKAMEEGTSVKVEVTDEAAPLPSAGGKYVAWLTTLQ